MSVTPLRRTSRNSRMVIAGWLASLGSAVAISLVAANATAAPGGDDWSLENKGDAPALVSQRIGRLRRSPLDGPQWRALQKAIGSKRLAAKIKALQRRNPSDVALRILAARATSAQGDPAAAAKTLEALIGKAGRFENAVFWLRIDMLDRADEDATAVRALESRAATQQGASADKALKRALSIADQAGLTGAAHRIAKALADNHPTSLDARLRLARAATRAGDSSGADAAYGRAVSSAPSRKKHGLVAERARARLRTDNPSGAARLLWDLVDDPKTGSKATREGWWDLLAEAHRKDGSTAMLITRLGAWVARNDRDPSAWRTLAQARETAGMDAMVAWRKVLQLAPKDQRSHAALVQALESKGETAAAIAEYKRLAGRDPSEVMLGLELANRLVAAGKREQGLQLAAEIEARVSRRGNALMALLDFYNLNDEQHLALDVAERLVVLTPRKAEARIALGEQLYQMRRLPAALKTWAMLPKLIRPAAAGWARHAEVLSEHGHTAQAITSLNKALKLAPAEPKYLRLRAVLAEDQRRPDTALGLWQHVRTLAKGRGQPLLADEARTRVVELLVGGAIAKRRQKLETELRLARKALDAKVPLSDAIEAGRFLAELQTRREHYGAAVSVQHQLVELMPDDAARLAELATAQRRAGQVESALLTLEELLVTNPGRSADVLAEMSELAFEAGDSTRALDAANRAAAKDRTQVDALVRLGELHEREGDTDQARKAYAAAVAVDATDVGARLRLAELELTLGEVDRSAHAFREILTLGGPPELLREAGRRALDLAEADDATMELVELAVQRTQARPEATEPREFLLEALDRAPLDEVTAWLKADGEGESRAAVLRQPLVAALTRGSVGARVRAAEHLGRLNLPDTAVPLARMGATLTAPRDATATVRDAFDRARIMALRAAGELRDADAIGAFNDAMTDASLSMGARHAAAWALAQADEPAAAKALMGNLSWGHDPMLAALGCIALARQSTADASDEHARR
ncbi:MAG: tetratricopeptide repeat protein, partial [Nannocystaceae bacterium]|nr:tetratricopeptide repeat protein [Nannocystaceae bacterium]